LGTIFLLDIFRIGFGLSDLLSFISLQAQSLIFNIYRGKQSKDAYLNDSVTDI
jgi:hypothetical protein